MLANFDPLDPFPAVFRSSFACHLQERIKKEEEVVGKLNGEASVAVSHVPSTRTLKLEQLVHIVGTAS